MDLERAGGEMGLKNKENMVKWKGIALALTGASLWGFSGNAAEWIFSHTAVTATWLVSVRMVMAGLLLLAYVSIQHPIFLVWKNKRDRLDLLVFSLTGMIGAQLTFFLSIEAGNAPTATLLQFLGPVFITIYFALRLLKWPKRKEWIAVLMALTGTFLLLTNGKLDYITVSKEAIFWGVLSGVSVAVYTVYPVRLLKLYSSAAITGWAMLLGGLAVSIFSQPWQAGFIVWTPSLFWMLGFVVIFGTLLPFYLYLDSLKYITSTETSLLGSAEPLVATIVSVVWLGTAFGSFQTAGGMLIILTVFLLSMPEKGIIQINTTVNK
ncbi:EamA family transporter [Fictibacillus phosphorivorans]|uniref:EamA family transporter n=1 Tax=Fictibacillus phosphorivorans TaxID=1221500 RepID=UPI00203B0CA7|nr:DMT family transporter [Fictibacillus phosphorivorans]MCM3718581.1 DMT family transporter [Fictibacillus phosphorivorans]MCM3776204.1 DMT family transporter [Fictibacillus phosphorivorans]